MANCEVCGKNYSSRTISGVCFCEECFQKLNRIRSGDVARIKYYSTPNTATCKTPKASKYMYDQAMIQTAKLNEYEEIEQQRKKAEDDEHQKQEYANSFEEFYEYDVITAVNTVDGRTDAGKLKNIIQEQAKKGWKLHTMYSNELGKNAISILGFGVNATASEDVMIFERRVKNNQ